MTTPSTSAWTIAVDLRDLYGFSPEEAQAIAEAVRRDPSYEKRAIELIQAQRSSNDSVGRLRDMFSL